MRDARVARAQEQLTAHGDPQPVNSQAAHSSANRAPGATAHRRAGPLGESEPEWKKCFVAPRGFSARSHMGFCDSSPGILTSASRTAQESQNGIKIPLAHTLYFASKLDQE